MINKKYTTDEERTDIIDSMESTGFVLRKDIIHPDGTGDLSFQSEIESQAEVDESILKSAHDELQSTDVGLARGLEDLIDLLDADGMNIRARLPQELQDKLARRKVLRGSLES